MNAGVNIIHIGHASFQWTTSSGTKILIDPYGNSIWTHWFDQQFPEMNTDITLVTHPHYDHNAIDRVKSGLILDKEGVIKASDYHIRGIIGHHARSEKFGSRNIIFVLEIDGIRFCHWGDNDANIDDNLLHQLGKIDVLLLPVDESEHLLTLSEVARIIDRLSPKVVIPMHFYESKLTSDCSTLMPINSWLSQQAIVRQIPPSGLILSSNGLPTKREVWVFERSSISTSMPESPFKKLPCFMQISAVWLISSALLVIIILLAVVKRRKAYSKE